MPDNSGVLAASAAATGSLVNAFATGNMNKKSRKFAEKMYNQQKADNLAFWNMQNEYNSPEQQMQRFTDAGLNPNLIYGQQNTAGPLTSPDVQKPEFNTPEFGNAIPSALSALDLVTNLEMKQAQTDNVRAQNDVIRQQAVLLGSQISGTEASTKRKLFDLNLETGLYETSVDARKEALRQMKANTDIAIRRDLREQVMMSSNLKEATQRISNMVEQQGLMRAQRANTDAERQRIYADTRRIKQQISLMSKEGVIKDLDVKLSKMDVRPGDPIWYRAVSSVMSSLLNWLNND